MSTILAIDTLAQRYGILPSRLVEEATTFDLFVCHSALKYQQIKKNESEGDFSHYSDDQLLAIKEGLA